MPTSLIISFLQRRAIWSRTMRKVGGCLTTSIRDARRRYHPAPASFGRYPVRQASSSVTSYPTPRHVPDSIPRPSYVPKNFFTAPWGEHDVPIEQIEPEGRIKLGSEDEKAVRKVTRMAAEILRVVANLVQVSQAQS